MQCDHKKAYLDKEKWKLKIVAISDSHSLHEKLDIPDGDVLVVAGDITSNGEMYDVINFNSWINPLPHKYKIIIPGNHDRCFGDGRRDRAIRLLCEKTYYPNSKIYYLENSGIEIDGLYFYGMPWMPNFFNWSFMLPRRSKELARKVNAIPDNTDILVTHSPPYGVLDKNQSGESCGCEILRRKVDDMPRLKEHFFGHIHEAAGDSGIFHNVSVVDRKYRVVNNPIIIEI